jgi:hypothetical protein
MARITYRVRRPVRRSRKPLADLPRPLAYIWQGWWPAHARGDGSTAEGNNQRHRRKRHIPEPFHSQSLLWLDRERIDDMTLMIGLYVGSEGFVVRTRK